MDTEARIRAAWEAGDHAEATAAAIRLYGAEVFGFLCALHHDPADADDAFSLFAEQLWRGMSGFEWRCSLRTWAYILARHGSSSIQGARARERRRNVSPSDARISQLAERVRTQTRSILRTENREAFARLRDELPEEDRTILVLRVDRNMPWTDVARVLGAEGDDVTREAARLRKRFQLVKDRLRTLGRERGLL